MGWVGEGVCEEAVKEWGFALGLTVGDGCGGCGVDLGSKMPDFSVYFAVSL